MAADTLDWVPWHADATLSWVFFFFLPKGIERGTRSLSNRMEGLIKQSVFQSAVAIEVWHSNVNTQHKDYETYTYVYLYIYNIYHHSWKYVKIRIKICVAAGCVFSHHPPSLPCSLKLDVAFLFACLFVFFGNRLCSDSFDLHFRTMCVEAKLSENASGDCWAKQKPGQQSNCIKKKKKLNKTVIACVGKNVAKSFGPAVVFVYIKCFYSTTTKGLTPSLCLSHISQLLRALQFTASFNIYRCRLWFFSSSGNHRSPTNSGRGEGNIQTQKRRFVHIQFCVA